MAAKRYACGFFIAVAFPFTGGRGGGRKAVGAPTDKSNSLRAAHQIGLWEAVTQPTYRSIAMPKASPRASAHRFAIVSNLPLASIYTGTKEQLIALGVARPEQFPEGRKRVKQDYSMESTLEEGWQVRKLKSGHFELRRGHKYVAPKVAPIPFGKFSIAYSPKGATEDSDPYLYTAHSNVGPLDKQTWQELWAAAAGIIKIMEQFNARFKRNSSHLKLVQPMTATGDK
ncbi:hypothetical protein SAMN05216412_11267 [Nitrosospira multiformis]|uniref:Uncharacterized protein n=1 Tax=Nitrosospira multiformis TaxID=1231 RepID=A0A1I0GB28_9PROT|nr:hypothetical protein [Nitrosospira multiformis]SET68075.1 hypothetical protein SAMN05216412_11267 [Nitrosospira multiformis]